MSNAAQSPIKSAREKREAEALRANLLKRKLQKQVRNTGVVTPANAGVPSGEQNEPPLSARDAPPPIRKR